MNALQYARDYVTNVRAANEQAKRAIVARIAESLAQGRNLEFAIGVRYFEPEGEAVTLVADSLRMVEGQVVVRGHISGEAAGYPDVHAVDLPTDDVIDLLDAMFRDALPVASLS